MSGEGITYTKSDDTTFETVLDPNFLCIYCEQPVVEASMDGTAICPWCDCGVNRDGTKWTPQEWQQRFTNARRRLEASA